MSSGYSFSDTFEKVTLYMTAAQSPQIVEFVMLKMSF